jgi:hypothetical protein
MNTTTTTAVPTRPKVDALVALAAGLSVADLGELRARLANLAPRVERTPTVLADTCLADASARPGRALDYLYHRQAPPPGKAWRDLSDTA